MRKLILLLPLLALQSWAAEVPHPGRPQIVLLGGGAYAFMGDMDVPNRRNEGLICNSAFIVTGAGVVVVDPGGSRQIGESLLREIRRRTQQPIRYVVNTHHHADHWMGNDAFARLKPRPVIIGHASMRATAQAIGPEWLGIIARLTGGANRGTRVVLPDRTVGGDEVLTLGGTELRLMAFDHAHTPGDLALFWPAQRLLIAGDVLFYQRTPGWQDADPHGNAVALEAMLKLAPERVLPGHGPVTDASGIRWMLDYIALLKREVQRHMDAGLTDYEMKDKIDVGPYRAMSGFEQRFGMNVNKMYLQLESQGFQ